MGNYVMHMEKRHSMAAIANIARHNERGVGYESRSNPDIDRKMTSENDFLIPAGVVGRVENRIKEVSGAKTVRKDAVRAVEFVFGGSPDYFEGRGWKAQNDYFSACVDWARGYFGAANVVGAVVHRDEKTPHLHLDIVPIYRAPDGGERLSAKEIFRGGAKKLHAIHEDFFQRVAVPFGLSRLNLDKDKKQKHISKKEHLTMIEQEKEKELDEILALKDLRTSEIKKKVTPEMLNHLVDGYMINSEQIGELRDDYKNRAEELREEATRQAGELRQEIAKLEATVKAGELARVQNTTLTEENKALKSDVKHLTRENKELEEKIIKTEKILKQVETQHPDIEFRKKFVEATKEVNAAERETTKKPDKGAVRMNLTD